MKKLSYIIVAFVIAFVLNAATVQAQVVLNEQFDSGEGQWATGWIDPSNAWVTFSIDTTSKLSGKNSYKAVIDSAKMEMYRIQRIHDLPLVAGYVYTVSFMAVSDSADAGINVLFEIAGSPYTQRLNDTASVTNTPKTFTYSMAATEDVPTNQLKFMMGSSRNNGKTIWIDSIVVTRVADPALVSQWGLTPQGKYWPIKNDTSYAAGNGTIAGDAINGSGWATIQGGFNMLQATMDSAVVVTGQIQFVGTDGGGSGYAALRYALAYQDSSTLNNALTDSAAWVGSDGYTGYEFDPRTGTSGVANAAGNGSGTVWTVNGSNWNSTYANGKPLTTVLQAPRNAEIKPGTYNFAFSIRRVDSVTNEIKWYLVEQNNGYWFGGTVVDTANTSKFNAVCFGVSNGDWTQVNLMSVRAYLGNPITVPEAPWQAYYVDQWGLTPQGKYWPIKNDTTYLVGNGTIAGDAINGSGWATIQGGFGQALPVKTDQALIVTGKLVFTGTDGGGSGYAALRYALAYQDSSTLNNALTDSAAWVGSDGYTGYEFDPRTGTSGVANAAGNGSGTVWTVNGSNWNSTYANGKPLTTVLQAPRNAEIKPGTYNFAFSVEQVNDTTNEVRWYLIEKNNNYWFGGIVMAPANTNQFNAICFGVSNGDWTELDVTDAKVDYGPPITVPEAPWQAYYVDQWGLTPQGKYWPIKNDTTYLVGNGTIAGDAINGSGWATIQGGFGQALPVKTDQALIVTGKLVFTGTDGGGSGYAALRYALAYQDSSTLNNALTDSAAWVGSDGYTGYEFDPVTGTSGVANAAGNGSGTVWTVNGSNWNSTYANGKPLTTVLQAPRNAEIKPGTYNFAFSVEQVNDTTNEVRWYLIEKNNNYWFGGIVMAPANTNQFNAICFGVSNGDWTELDVTDAKVDYGPPITIPLPPWQNFYIPLDQWGIYSRTGGWKLVFPDANSQDGNTSISGSGPVASGQWASVRGGFGQTIKFSNLPPDTSLVVQGKMEFVGGGFDGWSGLRFGVFYSDSAGTVDSTADGPMWSGSEAYSSGYLFCPNSGSNGNPNWSGAGADGSVGGVVNATWLSTNGADDYVLTNQSTTNIAGAGVYNFKLTFRDMGSQGTEVGYSIGNGSSYLFEGHVTDTSSTRPTEFNAVNFTVSGTNTSTTGLNLTDVQVVLGSSIMTGVSNENNNALPMVYSLSQNYPNPFNPSTTIKFGIPKAGNVSLVVYDILGRKVTELVNGELTAGYHLINFNASDLASGVYFYRLQAGDFVSVKKLMLLK